MMLSMIRRVFPRTIPVLAGYLFLGVAFGVSLKEQGYGLPWAFLMSAVIFAGSMQFALLTPLAQPFAPVTVALMTLLVNARHIFYGLSMLKPYEHVGPWKPYLVFALSDETYSLVCGGAPEELSDRDKGRWYAAISALDQSYWIIGSVLGALIGQLLPFDLTGIDFAMTALFTVIVTEQTADAVKAFRAGELSLTDMLFPTLLGLLTTLCSLLIVGKDSFLLCAMALMLAFFFLRYRMDGRRARA